MSREYKAIVMGMSAGGLNILMKIFNNLDDSFPLPVLIVQHLHPMHKSELTDIIKPYTRMNVVEASDKCKINPGNIYIAPADYHILVERNCTISLSGEEKVNYSRPSIDILFESAAYVWSDKLISMIFTGANNDGAEGTRKVKQYGGLTIAENPETADHPFMPKCAIDTGSVDMIYTSDEIKAFLENYLF